MTLRNITWILAFVVLAFAETRGQDMQYTYDVLGKLTSPEFAGRGYVNDGHLKAARYIQEEFISLGVKPLREGYVQPFKLTVNTFGGKMEVEVDGKALIPGKDYIARPVSGPAKGTFKVVRYNTRDLRIDNKMEELAALDLTETVLIFDLPQERAKSNDETIIQLLVDQEQLTPAAVIIVSPNKLTASYSHKQLNVPFLVTVPGKIPKSAQEIKLHIDAEVKHVYSQNVVGYLPGNQYPDSFILVSAHYDHMGHMGKEVYFPGANDNASGVSMMLQVAKYFAENPDLRAYSVLFIGFGGEEVGLVGSKHFVENPLVKLENIRLMLNMDIVGTGDEGIKVVNATEFPAEFNLLKEINSNKGYLKGVFPRGKAKNSDHYYFSEAGVPAFFIYTLGGNPAYHDINDHIRNLSLYDYKDLFNLLTDFIVSIPKSQPNTAEKP